jgi:uncharacterized repeat protein (TIGR01451 family)
MKSKKGKDLIFVSTIVVLSMFCLIWTTHSWGADKDDILIQNSLQKVRPLTSELLRLANDVRIAAPQAKSEVVNQLTFVAQRRNHALLNIIKKHPEVVLDVALPSGILESLPSDIQDYLEEEVTLEGEVEIFHFDNFDEQISWEDYLLTTTDKKHYALHFSGERPNILSHYRIKIRGVKVNEHIALKSAEGVQILSEDEAIPAATMKKVGIILFNFQNDTSQPYTQEHSRQVTFTASNSANAFYQETSFNKVGLEGKLRIDGDVYGWYTVPHNNTSCDYSAWASAARTAAAGDGFISTGYNVIVYAFPQTSACSWWGLGSIGGSPASSWVNGSYALRVVAHEMGHNFGAHHSSSYSCVDANNVRVPISTNCTSSEYGDPFDIMGSSTNHFNNFQKGRLGYPDTVNTQSVTTSGSYTIAPIEWATSDVQALRIPKEKDANGNVTQYYYLEYRQPYGFDSFGSTAPVVNGVSIRLAPPYSTISQSLLIDTTSETTSFSDAPLTVNKTFADPLKGITISTTGVSSSFATVAIDFGPQPCIRSNPIVSISPATQTGSQGQTLTYTLTLTNNDNSGCTDSPFTVTPSLPGGLSQLPTFVSENVSPGATVTRTLLITSDLNTSIGFYTFTETAMNTSDPVYSASSSGIYEVRLPDTTPPVVTILSPLNGSTLPKKGTVAISATANDTSGINRINIYIDDILIKTCLNMASCKYKWNVSRVSSGNHTITVQAIDKAPTPNTGSSSITVTK